MGSRILLMVQNGDGRVKCIGKSTAEKRQALRSGLASTQRWWEVEAENAEAARTTIDAFEHPHDFTDTERIGHRLRILSHGSKQEGRNK